MMVTTVVTVVVRLVVEHGEGNHLHGGAVMVAMLIMTAAFNAGSGGGNGNH